MSIFKTNEKKLIVDLGEYDIMDVYFSMRKCLIDGTFDELFIQLFNEWSKHINNTNDSALYKAVVFPQIVLVSIMDKLINELNK